ncbi:MAG: hypothetical protein M3297_14965 [Thermoproteota archaeon]|jgi:hypothetical protein|nr:hypothetical protein [Thermoproteota archaeon]
MDPQDQRKILEGICYIALTVDEKIQFVGIIEGSGKLLVGKHRQNIEKIEDQDYSCLFKPSIIYSRFIIPTLNSCKKSGKDSIELVQLDNLKLAIMPLLMETDRFLCIYLHPSASYKEIIGKVIETV